MTNYLEIPYEALGPDGRERSRYACTIGELPHSMRLQACEDATKRIAHLIGRESTRRIPFGMPVYVAFSMRPADADRHNQRKAEHEADDDRKQRMLAVLWQQFERCGREHDAAGEMLNHA